MIADFHMHTEASEDSEAPVRSMCDAAVERGIGCIAITDHVEMTDFYKNGYDIAAEESWRYATEVQEEYAGRLRIARGIELGQPRYDPVIAERVLAAHPYDFVLGSMHKLGDEVDYYYYDYTGRDVGEVMDRYFDALYDMVEWGGFHSMAHMTYPFRYLPADKRPADYSRWQGRIDRVLRRLAEKGLALEINTSGLRGPIGETSPTLKYVKRFCELGGEYVTLGSDAHAAEDLGEGIQQAMELACQAGFSYFTFYKKRQPRLLQIY